MLKRLASFTPLFLLQSLEGFMLKDYSRTLTFMTSSDPDLFHTIADRKVVETFKHAAAVVPAYKDLLKKKKIDPMQVNNADDFNRLIPITEKKNYIHKYDVENRCVHGLLPLHGNIDESGGTSGTPTNWIRSVRENDTLTHVAKFEFEYLYGISQKDMIVLSAWSCGPWATGIKFCQLMQQHALVKSCGPDVQNIVQTLKLFGTDYEYIIAGYPPFLKKFVDEAKIPLKKYRIHLLTGGEGISVQWKSYLKKKLWKKATIVSSYGASDIDIGIGFETPFCDFIRHLCEKNVKLRHKFFGSIPMLPMLFQYNPMTHYITQTYNRTEKKYEFIVTLMDTRVASPKIKYNLHDEGGVYTFNGIMEILEEFAPGFHKRYIKEKGDWPILQLPFLFVAGRTDGTISLDGANVYPSQIEAGILTNKELEEKTQAFMIYKETGKNHKQRFAIAVHLKRSIRTGKRLQKKYHDIILKEIKLLNPDFVESYRANKQLCDPKIVLHKHNSALFAGEEDSVKVHYFKKD
jgi:phenylacetate-CoA ligase